MAERHYAALSLHQTIYIYIWEDARGLYPSGSVVGVQIQSLSLATKNPERRFDRLRDVRDVALFYTLKYIYSESGHSTFGRYEVHVCVYERICDVKKIRERGLKLCICR